MKYLRSVLLFSLIVLLLSTGNSGGGTGKFEPCGAKDLESDCNSQDNICQDIIERNIDVHLTNAFPCPPERKPSTCFSGFASIASPNPFLNALGATSSSDYSRYYVTIRVTAIDCPDYDRLYVWNVSGTTQSIPVPQGLQYQVRVEYREQCTNFWNTTGNQSGQWRYSQTVNSDIRSIIVSGWIYSGYVSC